MTTIWSGTVDNLDLSGETGGDVQPTRILENEDGELSLEFAFSRENGDGEIVYDETRWDSNSSMRFRDMDPAIESSLQRRLLDAGLIDA
jgi:hypothetical protein